MVPVIPPVVIVLLAVALGAAVWALTVGWKAARQTSEAPLPLPPESLDYTYFSLERGWVCEPFAEAPDPSDEEACRRALEEARAGIRRIEVDPETGIPVMIRRTASEWEEMIKENGGADLRGATPFLSVIVYAFDPRFHISELIDALSSQRASFRYELIIVCDLSAQETAALVEQVGPRKGVHLTFVPPGSHNLSRRKLAYTIGMKAARGQVCLLTASNIEIPSLNWFQLMAQPFCHEVEDQKGFGVDAEESVVMSLGMTRLDMSAMRDTSRWYRQFLTVMHRSRAISAAMNGHAYRGDWMNIALSRKAFFDNKGYRSSLYLQTGDDDLFVCEMSKRGKVVPVIAPMAMPASDWGDSAVRFWKQLVESYHFTARWLPRRPFLLAGTLSVCQWVVLTAVVLAGLYPLLEPPLPLLAPWCSFNFIPAVVAGLLWICFELLQIRCYRRAATRLMMPRLWWSIPVFLLWRPVGNLLFRLNHRSSSRRNFTWRRS